MKPIRLDVGDIGEEVTRLHETLKKNGFEISPEEMKRKFFGPSTREAVQKCQKKHGLSVTGCVDEETAKTIIAERKVMPTRSVESKTDKNEPFFSSSSPVQPKASPGDTSTPPGTGTDGYHVEGRIFFDYGLPAVGLTVRAYNLGFGGVEALLGETKTNDEGFYSLSYNASSKPVNLEMRVVDMQGKEISLSATKFNADKHEVLNLVAPGSIRPLAPEYQRLSNDLMKNLGNLSKLTDTLENTERKDITILHQSTGWDARLIALAATANKLSGEIGIPHDALYALFRVGLPSDKQQLASVSITTVEKALSKAKESGIVSLDDQQTGMVKNAFENFAGKARLETKAIGALSSFGDLLSKSGLNEEEKRNFTEIYFSHSDEPAELWKKAREKNIPEGKIRALRLQGKLAYLTYNNADLTQKLQQEIGSVDNLAQLVDKDLYQRDTWKKRLTDIAGNNEQELQKIIPPVYVGEKTADRLDAYASDLAKKVRLSFHTKVIGRMIEKGDLRLGTGHDVAKVSRFLKNAENLGFELGQVPVEKFVRDNRGTLFNASTPEVEIKSTTQGIKKLHRLYQITPDDETLIVLSNLGFTSAHDIESIPYDVFLDRFGDKFDSKDKSRSREKAKLVYRKSQQVSVVTRNFFTIAKQLDSAPPLYAMSPSAEVRENAKNELIKHYPTMESLFGSLDFCECEHCRSVLSPAAYLVDLLQFLDPKDLDWQFKLIEWKQKHRNVSYPFNNQSVANKYHNDWKQKYNNAPFLFKSQSEWTNFLNDWRQKYPGQSDPDPEIKLKPYDVLVERRPDLSHLPLTCENTHTVLPYIDIVNEILEYYVANSVDNKKGLEGFSGYDTGDAATTELLAEPQNIIPKAYEELVQARYPLTLPFDLWIETVRRFLDHFDTPLWQVLETFRTTDELFPPASNPKPYYRTAVFTEYLGISPAEYNIFIDQNPLAKWYELYGYTSSSEALNVAIDADTRQRIDLNSAKALSRRLGVSYKELVNLVRTWFINPQLEALGFLPKLGVSADEVLRYKQFPGHAPLSAEEREAYEKRLQELADGLKLTVADLNAQIDAAWQAGNVNKILVLRDFDTGCNFDKTILQYANGNPANGFVFLKINLFVRLWKKLGWTIEETDRALQAFIPKNSLPLTGANIGEATKTALIYSAHLKILSERVRVGKNSRLKLRTLWSDLSTTGKNSLYSQLFLIRSLLKNDPVFDQPLGKYLCYFDSVSGQYNPFSWDATKPEDAKTGNVSLKSHLLAVQGALNLTADDIGRILADAKGQPQTDAEEVLAREPLTLANVSLLYRYGLLAKALKMPVRDLIALKAMSGLDPFKSLEPAPIISLSQDYPFEQTIRFIEVVEKFKGSGFKVEDIEYLMRHRFDPVGKYRPNDNNLLALLKLLATGIQRIQAEHAVPADPASLTDDQLQQKLALVLPPELLASFFGTITGTMEYGVILENVQPADKLDPKAFVSEPTIRVSYDAVRRTQQLTYRGLLLDAKKAQLKVANSSAVLANLLDAVQNQAFAFFAGQIENVIGSLIAMVEFDAIEENVQPANKLDPMAFVVEPTIRVSYDEVRKIQQLTHRGMLIDAKKAQLKAANTSTVLANLLDSVQNQTRDHPYELIISSLSMLINTVEFESIEKNVQSTAKLDPNDFDREPAIRLIYDKVDQTQRLILRGLLSSAKVEKLKTDNPSTMLANLLDAVQNQAKEFIQKLRNGFLLKSDFDSLFTHLDNLGDITEERRAKLVKVFLPFIIEKLTCQLVVQTLATSLNADPSLTEALIINAGLLTDPSNTGKPLLDAFSVAGERGVSAAFFNTSGTQLDQTRTVETADTAITIDSVPIKPIGALSAHFDGYFEVPSSGAYRFFVVFGKTNAEAELRLTHLPDPLLRGKAVNDGAEISQFIELKHGVPYHFTFEISNLSNGDVSLLVQSENLPKGSLARMTLYPQAVAERVFRAYVLLEKALQLIQGLGLSERDVRHILTHRTDFDNLDLSKLPTRETDDTPAGATALFGQFLRLAGYAALKRDLAEGTDDLIGIFENARRIYPASTDPNQAKAVLFEDICKRVADLTRREVTTVQVAAQHFGFIAQHASSGSELRVNASDFAQERGIQRLWDALQIVERLGVPVEAIVRWTEIVNTTKAPNDRFAIALDLKNTVKTRYEQENWQRVAQSIFDKLRQRQRDALVAYILPRHGFERIEQLFEYFLIDPGMEPVVQTSRLRLAISSVQLFIQRCLLNLEPLVHPSAINSKHWQWMKRYRVWEANRKIFLFPENWLEPEFRDDKTHLFQELEGALLQGDVSNDLVEDAFFNYLKKLEELARLDMVTMFCEEKPLNPESNTLHVIGRTFSQPHKYFYRRYSHQMWTPWEPVTAEIEGDHIVAIIWRDRLHLFWVTFLEKVKQEKTSTSGTSGNIAGLSLDDVSKAARLPTKVIEVQLNWSEYFQGQWTTRESSGFGKPISVEISPYLFPDFKTSEVFIYSSQEDDGSVKIHLDTPINKAFHVVSKNSPPEPVDAENPYDPPYSAIKSDNPTCYTNSDSFQVTFIEKIETKDGHLSSPINKPTKDIFREGRDKYFLLFCSDLFSPIDLFKKDEASFLSLISDYDIPINAINKLLNFVESILSRYLALSSKKDAAIILSDEWKVVKEDIINASKDYPWTPSRATLPGQGVSTMAQRNTGADIIGSLIAQADNIVQNLGWKYVRPFFYQDNYHTFFVEPLLTDITTIEWEEWGIKYPLRDKKGIEEDWLKVIPIKQEVPLLGIPIEIDKPEWLAEYARFKIESKKDWLVNPVTVSQYGNSLIGQGGGLDFKEKSVEAIAGGIGTSVGGKPGNGLTRDGMSNVTGKSTLGTGSFTYSPGKVRVIGGGGANLASFRDINARGNTKII